MRPLAFLRYFTVMPLGIQRIEGGIETSVARPAVSSAALHSAIACTVPMWFWTLRRCAKAATQRPGSSTSSTAELLAK